MTKQIPRDFSRQLSAATDVDPSVADVILATAVAHIKARRPDLAPRLDDLLADRRWTRRAARLIGRLARFVRPD